MYFQFISVFSLQMLHEYANGLRINRINPRYNAERFIQLMSVSKLVQFFSKMLRTNHNIVSFPTLSFTIPPPV